MGYEDSKSRGQAIGNAMKIAAELAIAEAQAAGPDVGPLDVFKNIVEDVVQVAIDLQAQFEIKDAFPGSVVIPEIPVAQPNPAIVSNVVPIPSPAYQPPAAPAPAPSPIPGATDGDPAMDALWREFFADPSAWYNNIYDPKRPARAPEIKHKQRKTPDGKYQLGLYINDKKNPSWVKQALVSAGLLRAEDAA